jgi:hypothetical protein
MTAFSARVDDVSAQRELLERHAARGSQSLAGAHREQRPRRTQRGSATEAQRHRESLCLRVLCGYLFSSLPSQDAVLLLLFGLLRTGEIKL